MPAGLCGVLFILVKTYEWSVEIAGGQTNSNAFYAYFYVLIGLIALGGVVRELRNPSRRRPSMAEAGAIYWHMVDPLRVVIFALLYVPR